MVSPISKELTEWSKQRRMSLSVAAGDGELTELVVVGPHQHRSYLIRRFYTDWEEEYTVFSCPHLAAAAWEELTGQRVAVEN